jgi:glycosyltransferase involved in cell wall biosynthesis
LRRAEFDRLLVQSLDGKIISMEDKPLISVITPALNSARHLEAAIASVLAQDDPDFEHIVMDGDSRDGTVDLLKRHPHLNWISEPDQGQSDAMNKGFALSRGEIVVYLNADDVFEPGAFRAVREEFSRAADFVVGKVRILRDEGPAGPTMNDPKTELKHMLRWWQDDAFCYNSAGYFCRRWVLESVGPFNVQDHYHMDYEFLIEARRRCPFTKVDKVLAGFRLARGTKTVENWWNVNVTMKRFDGYAELLEPQDRAGYAEEYAAYLRQWEKDRPRLDHPGT